MVEQIERDFLAAAPTVDFCARNMVVRCGDDRERIQCLSGVTGSHVEQPDKRGSTLAQFFGHRIRRSAADLTLYPLDNFGAMLALQLALPNDDDAPPKLPQCPLFAGIALTVRSDFR